MLLLLALEGALVTLIGVGIGVLATVLAIAAAGPWLQSRFGIALRSLRRAPTNGPVLAVIAAGVLASLVPAWRAYRLSLADGLSPRT